MTDLHIIHPDTGLKEQYLNFYQERKESGEKMIPWVIDKDPSDFEGMVHYLANNSKGIGFPKGWVPDSTYWLVDGGKTVLGVVNIRHQLTELLMKTGGHIGYGTRPSARKKGYATKLLELALKKAREIGIEKALVVCDESNTGSMKTILKNGGVADTDFIEEDGNIVKRFWIEV